MRTFRYTFTLVLGAAAAFAFAYHAGVASANTAPLLPVHMASAQSARQQNACHKLAYQFGLGAPALLMELARECDKADPNDCVNARILTGGQAMSPFKEILRCGGRGDN